MQGEGITLDTSFTEISNQKTKAKNQKKKKKNAENYKNFRVANALMSLNILCKTLCFSPRWKNIFLILILYVMCRAQDICQLGQLIVPFPYLGPSKLRWRNLKMAFSRKRIKCFPSMHATPGSVFEENLVTEIKCLSWRHRSWKPPFPSTLKRAACVFKFLRMVWKALVSTD